MKKVLYIIGFLMMATAVVRPFVVFGANEPYSADYDPYTTTNLFARILPQGMSEDMFESFGDTNDKDAGKDLYLKILKKTEINPENQAVKNIAGRYGMSQNDMEFVRSGSYQPLLAKKPTMSQEDLINKMNEMRNKVDEERQVLAFKADIEQATTPSEIFANGDVKDSGFDLINDLSIIEKLLFMKSEPIDIGNSYNKDSSSDDGGGGSGAGTPAPSGQTGQPQPQQPGQVNIPNTPQVILPGGSGPTPPSESTQEATQEQCPPGTEPASLQTGGPLPEGYATPSNTEQTQCSDTSDLAKAITEFGKNNGTVKSAPLNCVPLGSGGGAGGSGGAAGGNTGADGSNPPDDGGSGSGAGDQNGTVTPSVVADANADPFPEKPLPDTPPVEPAPADDWKKDRVCWGKFCLTIDYFYETPTSKYADADNCINCHIEKINDQLKKTISHSLSPNKIPGNLIETPKCKNGLSASLSSLSMNLNVQFMPIKTPLNDDLILDSSAQEDLKYFCENTAFFPEQACKNLANDAVPPDTQELPSLDAQATKRILAMAPDNIDFEAVITKANQDIQARKEQQSVMEEQIDSQRSANPNLLLYKSLLVEIDQMIYYFKNISDILHSLHEKVPSIPGEQACTNFKNKKVCS